MDYESLAPTQGATQQSIGCQSLTTFKGPRNKADCEAITPTQGATQQSVDKLLNPTQGAPQQSVDCESLTPTQGAAQQSVDGEFLTQLTRPRKKVWVKSP